MLEVIILRQFDKLGYAEFPRLGALRAKIPNLARKLPLERARYLKVGVCGNGGCEANLRNIEIKARVESLDKLAAKVVAIATGGPVEIVQDDTFFPCSTGRLKLRDFLDGTGELIFYRRADKRGPKESFYLRSPTVSPDSLRESLILAYGQSGRIRKHRTLYLVDRTRVHLDSVEKLGTFLELEVVLEDDESTEVGAREAAELMKALGISPGQLIEGAYVDLLATGAQI